MAQRAKIFQNDGSQAVRLPDELQFDEAENVLIYRRGRKVFLEPAQTQWSQQFLDLAGSAPNFPYPEEPPPTEAGQFVQREGYTAAINALSLIELYNPGWQQADPEERGALATKSLTDIPAVIADPTTVIWQEFQSYPW